MTSARHATVPPSPRNPTAVALRLLMLNTQHSSPERARRQADWMAAQEGAGIVVITEVSSGTGGDALASALTGHGYHSIVAPPSVTRDYRTVLASRDATLEVAPSGIGVLPHRAPGAIVTLGGQEVGLLGLYVPSRGPRERRNEDKRAFQAAVTQALPGFLARFSGPVIVAGDLNVVEPGHQPRYPVFGSWEYDFYRAFAAAGMTDAYRACHPDDAGHSWYGRGGNGYRFDHVFITSVHARLVRDCGYLHEPRQQGLTDHAAMTLALGPEDEDDEEGARR
jgi:exodeoxyribonuclease III